MRNFMVSDAFAGALIFGGSVCYSIYCVYKVSTVVNSISIPNSEFYFNDGWSILKRKRDIVDEEWENGKSLYVSLAPWLLFQSIISVLFHHKSYLNYLYMFQIICSALYIIINLNLLSFILIILQPITFQLLIITIKFKKRVIWVCSLINIMIFFNINIKVVYNFFHQLQLTDNQVDLLYIALYWINIRCVCYYIDYTENPWKCNITQSLSYCLYLPLLFLGPFIQYKDFKKCREFNNDPLKLRLLLFMKNLIRFIFWWIFTDISLHYIYVNFFPFFPELVKTFDSVTLYGFGYSMGQFFHLKYVVLYGLSTTFAQFDGIPTPNIPKCIGRIHLYSDMWKYFDNGLYQFLLKYIYIPVKNFTSSPYVSNIICFLFIFVWHGFMRMDIFVWVTLNCLGVMIERFFKNIGLQNYFNIFWERHLSCMINAPLLMMSAISNFYFFGGTTIGNIFVYRVIEDKLSSTFILLFTLYSCGLFSIYVKQKEIGNKKLSNKTS
ncbi:protein-cysteine N-palmitoyltransferase Rasp [Onthophagus taurus]|uniref:protein-cysteine N-palmitoyltransferase Rasp n=1 Tax=Onthophagus taurus TaxID=166361 RepID=UPI0039BDE37D